MRALRLSIITLVCVAFTLAKSTTAVSGQELPAYGLGVRVCHNGSELFDALVDSSVQVALLPNDISLSTEEWSASIAPVTIERNVQILGMYEEPGMWPVLDLCFVAARVSSQHVCL